LIGQGDPRAAAAILARAPGLDRNPDLARVAAESALLAGEDARACAIEAALTAGRDDVYWVRLRTYCQAVGGRAAEAQLTFEVAQSQGKDAVFTRLMAAKLAGAGDPGAPSLRNGLDYALSRNLGLDLGQAKPSPVVAAALAQGGPTEPAFDLTAAPPELAGATQAIAAGGPFATVELERLLDAADTRDPKVRARASAAALIAEAFAEPLGPTLRARIAALATPEGKGPAGRNLALEAAGSEKRAGETALLVLWTCAEAGPAGLAFGDRARVVRALRHAGLDADARAFALEGLVGLK
ncbi:MAG: fliK, partial [Phenylobacterium sp.]|nr:fliK [Phenylobacterium sp.]